MSHTLQWFVARVFRRPKAARKAQKDCVRESHKMRERLSQRQIDKTLADSFPASDPPAWY